MKTKPKLIQRIISLQTINKNKNKHYKVRHQTKDNLIY